MSSIADLHKRMIMSKIEEDIRKYGVDMNTHEEKPMFPEKQISDTIDYLRGEGCINDIDVTCENGNITNDGILTVNLEITLKPDTIIKDFK
jgi:hypothetical protein